MTVDRACERPAEGNAERRLSEHAPREVAVDEEIWLLGQPLLREYLDFVKHCVVDGPSLSRAALTDEWREANDYYHELEQRESGIADQVEHRDLDPTLLPLVEEVTRDPRFRRTFDTLPTSFGLVELDRLVVYQKSVTGNFVESIRSKLGPSPSPEALFRFCVPLDRANAPVKMRRTGSRRWAFRCDSTDFRFHEAVLLRPGQIRDYDSFGSVAGVLGLVVGFGSNFLNVIRVGKRMLLHNGYHRACALRSAGITHAPAVIQTVTRHDELEATASSTVMRDPEFYFRTHRPPLLKDFFDPKIRRSHRVQKQVRTVEVTFEVREAMGAE